jgi:hypothetical protein
VSAGLRRARAFAVWLLLIVAAGDAYAGAWLMPPGQGQIIAGTAFSGSSRAFDAHGNLIPVPSYKKFELGAYVEYGLTDWLTLLAAPAYDIIRQPAPAPSYTGPGESGIGGRFKLYQSDAFVASLQTTLLTPGASFNGAEPHRAGAIDLRAMAGASFTSGAWPAFADAAAGYRFYAQAQPGEWKLDLTLGVRPLPQLLVLLQSFGSMQMNKSANFPRSSWEKLQGSFVYDLNSAWSAQLGAFLTVAGINAGRELGPMAAIWYRF